MFAARRPLAWLLLPGLVGCGSVAGPHFVLQPAELPPQLPSARLVASSVAVAPAGELLTSAAQWRRLAARWGLGEQDLPSPGFDWRSTDLLVVALGDAGSGVVQVQPTEEEGVLVLLITRQPPVAGVASRPAVLVAELVRGPAQVAVVFRQQLADQPGVERTLAVFAGR